MRPVWISSAVAALTGSIAATLAFGTNWLTSLSHIGNHEARYALPVRLEQVGVPDRAAHLLAAAALVAGSVWLVRQAARGRPRGFALGACLLVLTSPWLLAGRSRRRGGGRRRASARPGGGGVLAPVPHSLLGTSAAWARRSRKDQCVPQLDRQGRRRHDASSAVQLREATLRTASITFPISEGAGAPPGNSTTNAVDPGTRAFSQFVTPPG